MSHRAGVNKGPVASASKFVGNVRLVSCLGLDNTLEMTLQVQTSTFRLAIVPSQSLLTCISLKTQEQQHQVQIAQQHSVPIPSVWQA